MEFEYIGLLLLCGAAMWAFIVAWSTNWETSNDYHAIIGLAVSLGLFVIWCMP